MPSMPGGGARSAVNLHAEHPWVLIMLALASLPFLFSGARPATYPWLNLMPQDSLSSALGFALRLLGTAAIAALVVALSEPQRGEQRAERLVEGAQVVIVLDRSRSMNETFGGQGPNGRDEESKAQAASRLLLNFINRRPDNVYGMVEFTSSPIYTLPLTTKDTAIRAAIRAAGRNGLALTNVASPLVMAAELFEGRAYQGSRVILLVSDGAAAIDEQTGNWLRDAFQQFNMRLYWIYIPSENSPGIFAKVPYDELPVGGVPEQMLDRYFQTLGVPYTAYEARDPAALRLTRSRYWPAASLPRSI
jgi:mxaC protein